MSNAFITLTYDDEHLTVRNGVPILQKWELQQFLKKLNRQMRLLNRPTFRYFAAGEYGDKSWRPHYHAILFGYPSCARGLTRRMRRYDIVQSGDGDSSMSYTTRSCCPSCDAIYYAWGKGIIENSEVTEKSSSYVAGYVSKKLTNAYDPRLGGRDPEFGLHSRRPGLGFEYLHKILEHFNANAINYADPETGELVDVPVSIPQGPLDRYSRAKLREMDGRPPGLPLTIQEANRENMLILSALQKEHPYGPRKEVLAQTAVRRAYIKNKLKLVRGKDTL